MESSSPKFRSRKSSRLRYIYLSLSVCVITVAKTALSSDSDACSEVSARGRSDKEEVLPYIVRVTYRLPQRCHVWTWG